MNLRQQIEEMERKLESMKKQINKRDHHHARTGTPKTEKIKSFKDKYATQCCRDVFLDMIDFMAERDSWEGFCSDLIDYFNISGTQQLSNKLRKLEHMFKMVGINIEFSGPNNRLINIWR